ncbi:hypothetical protein ACNOYE_16080 [Nannocystaceae bacterium ST9]
MSPRPTRLALAVLFVSGSLALTACDGARQEKLNTHKQTRDLKDYNPEMSPEELANARKAAGHDSQDEIAAENAKMFEKGAREWIKTRMPEYRDFVADFRDHVDTIEKEAPKWKDDKAFAKFEEKYKERVKTFVETYDELTGKGAEGGNTQVEIGKAFRDWEALKDELSPGVADSERFPEILKGIRDTLDVVGKALDEIEADETLEINPLYKPKKKKGK